MRSSLLRKLRMYINVQAVLLFRKNVWETSVAFTTEVDDLDDHIKNINAKNQQQKGTESISKAKKQGFENMIDTTLVICGAGTAYASRIKDDGLKATFDYSESDLKKGNEKNVLDRCVIIGRNAEPLLDKLVPQYMPAEQLTVQTESIAVYAALLNAPREVRTADKSIKEEMQVLFDECDTLLNERLDGMMLAYKKTNPDFYTEYINARYIGGWSKKKDGEEPKE